MEPTIRDDRLDMHLSAEQQALIERAAAVSGQPIDRFAVSALVERARDVLSSHETTVLSERDRDRFIRLLDEAEPAAPLQRAAQRFAPRA